MHMWLVQKSPGGWFASRGGQSSIFVTPLSVGHSTTGFGRRSGRGLGVIVCEVFVVEAGGAEAVVCVASVMGTEEAAVEAGWLA